MSNTADITTQEAFESREYVEGRSATLTYHIFGTSDESLAIAALRRDAPLRFPHPVNGPLMRQDLQVAPRGVKLWRGVVGYTTEGEPAVPNFSFDFAGERRRIEHSLATVSAVARPPAPPPDFGRLVGVSPDGRVEGVEVLVPTGRLVENHRFPFHFVTRSYRDTLRGLLCHVNDAPFRDFAAGECLFTGVSAQRPGGLRESDWEITFTFEFSPNANGISVGGLPPVDKRGWEYLWVYPESAVANGRLSQRPFSAHVERVYPIGNFALLGIGGETP